MTSVSVPLTTLFYRPSDAFPIGFNAKWAYIPVTLTLGNRIVHRVDTLIDTGALWTIFSRPYADGLGIDLKSGEHNTVHGVGGMNDLWFHKIKLSFKKWSYECKVGFMEGDLPVAGILGYVGFFDRFKYTVDSSANNFTLERLH